ncbi:MAG: fumarylacetoacetase [Planctomycetota bacterium]
MPPIIDDTHDPSLESWIESANDPETDFPIQNLPLCHYYDEADDEIESFPAVRVGDALINLPRLGESGIVSGDEAGLFETFFEDILDEPDGPRRLRRRLSELLRADAKDLQDHPDRDSIVVPVGERIGFLEVMAANDYTDFYASVYHATNVGSMFRPDNPLLPNYKWIPVGYHGRSSTVHPSGEPVYRPRGQQAPAEEGTPPRFGPCRMLDYEVELGVVLAHANERGRRIPIDRAEEHILGLCLLNDWSARDVQKWEYQPLGPFLAKSFHTTVSPYLVTTEALAPFRCPAQARAGGDPAPLPHLLGEDEQRYGGIDITLEASLLTEKMRGAGLPPHRLSRGSFKDMYWTIAQMLTHHASNGCEMRAGDLLGSGTVSGPTRGSRGCLLELTWDGDPFASPPVRAPGTQRTPIELPSGETRLFLEDGDEVILTGFCENEGFRRIGFGECRGVVHPPLDD